MQNGPKYAISKEGLIKLVVIALASTTFALLLDTNYYRYGRKGQMEWVFAAFIIALAISLLFYIFRITGAADRMSTCGPCTFDGFDFLWSWFSSMWCLAAAAVFAMEFNLSSGRYAELYRRYSRRIEQRIFAKVLSNIILGFVTAIMYAVEAYQLRSRAPAYLGYISTKKGWLKTASVVLGAAAFGLIVDWGFYDCVVSECGQAFVYVLIAYVVGWVATVIIWFLHIIGVIKADYRRAFATVEFSWSVICILLFLSGSIVSGVILGKLCTSISIKYPQCRHGFGSVVIAAINAALYIVDAVLNKLAT